tara:strand:+ start:607 stop:741 length:135 start_codon:yes stop_codon:yes gene_type:complete
MAQFSFAAMMPRSVRWHHRDNAAILPRYRSAKSGFFADLPAAQL